MLSYEAEAVRREPKEKGVFGWSEAGTKGSHSVVVKMLQMENLLRMKANILVYLRETVET